MSSRSEYHKHWRIERKKKGLCFCCDHPVGVLGRVHCLECAERIKPQEKAAREQRRKEGLCIRGDKRPAIAGTPFCQDCRTKSSEKQKQQYRELRPQVLGGYGGACVCCGERIDAFLTLDHTLNNGAEERKQSNYNLLQLYRRVIAEKFPPEYQLLCWNCNCGRAKNGGICPHKETTDDILFHRT